MSLKEYYDAIDKMGMYETWCRLMQNAPCLPDIGELYEMGLAHVSKEGKKMFGKYYTPHDVATLMAKWLVKLEGENVCDVCCGVGNLVMAYLRELGLVEARKLVLAGKVWLYDVDGLAARICIESMAKVFGQDLRNHVHLMTGDFLNKDTHLPPNAKVISNPPYAKASFDTGSWVQTPVIKDTKEMYCAILEKIMDESRSFVAITPQNFLGREKFKELRKKMDDHSGFIIPFDNTPGQVFNGRKHGVFNTNTQNQVRPAITVCDNNPMQRGFKVAGMVRFKNEERDGVLVPSYLEGFVGDTPQRTPNGERYAKCFPQLENLLLRWRQSAGKERFKDHISPDGECCLNFVTTCRYHTVAYVSDLFRSGKRIMKFKDEETRDLAYCWLNSSFCYWHWRLYDGEITYQQGMLDEMPTFFNKLSEDTKNILVGIAREMQALEQSHIVRKKNSGKMMESIRFPEDCRTKINNLLLLELGVKCDGHDFDLIHAHSVVDV